MERSFGKLLEKKEKHMESMKILFVSNLDEIKVPKCILLFRLVNYYYYISVHVQFCNRDI